MILIALAAITAVPQQVADQKPAPVTSTPDRPIVIHVAPPTGDGDVKVYRNVRIVTGRGASSKDGK